MAENIEIYKWVPLNSVGPFKFGEPIEKYEKTFHLERKEYLDDPTDEPELYENPWKAYSVPDVDINIYTEKDLVFSIYCSEIVTYKGVNLIGMNIHEALGVIDEKPDSWDDDKDAIEMANGETWWEVHFDSLELTLSHNEHKVIVSASLRGPIPPD